MRHLASLGRGVLDLIAPQDCFACASPAGASALCVACAAVLPRRPPSACPRCALPGLDGGCCGACRREPPPFEATRALYDFSFPVDAMIQALKYRHKLALARFFADELVARAADFGGAVDLVVPMPLHPRRLASRGFNQAVELARPYARARGVPLALTLVRRVRHLPTQASLGADERQRNPRGAFACEADLTGLRIVMVDDVMTTGATLAALAQCVRQRGAAWVGSLVLARTPAPY